MNNTIEALQNLYVAMGGQADDVANLTIIPDLINAIATQAATIVAAANEKELPKVTSTDNGKLLTVVAGKWDKAAPAEE